jgi:molecular chaperone GrpE
MGRKQHADDDEILTEQDAQAASEDEAGGVEAGAEAVGPAAEAAEWRERYLRAVADTANIRRRLEREAEEAKKFASERLVSDLLPVLDNFARALEAAERAEDLEGLRSGVALIHRQLSDVLQKTGLERLEAVGQPFDPNLHEAILQVEPEEGQAPHEVVEELRAGYRLGDRVLRPTLVKVTSG